MPNPVVHDLHDLESLLLTTTKYEMQYVIDAYKMNLEYPVCIQRDPLRLYTIACGCGLDNQAKYVARNAELPAVIEYPSDDDLNGLTAASYSRLISFLIKRDNELHPILEQSWTSFISYCDCLEKRRSCMKRQRRNSGSRVYIWRKSTLWRWRIGQDIFQEHASTLNVLSKPRISGNSLVGCSRRGKGCAISLCGDKQRYDE